MDTPRDFQLLDDDDDNVNLNDKVKHDLSSASQQLTVNVTEKSNKPIVNKYNISPNRPNSGNKLELKQIERRRVNSPLKMKGIEDYVQQYASSNNANANTNDKITMNLKMDDLLASVKNESSYQTLADFSVMTGENEFDFNKNRNKKRHSNAIDSNNFEHNIDGNNNDDNDFEDDDDDESKYDKDNKGNLNYKYTATYRKDETTGSFQEQSKIIFENKLGTGSSGPPPSRPKPPVPPPPSSMSTVSKMNEQSILPAPPSPPQSRQHPHDDSNDELTVYQPSETAQSQLQLALEALRNNSKKLELKLDKIDDITPSSNQYFDSSSAAVGAVGDLKNNNASTEVQPTIKKKNDSFFTEFLNKSDDLIAQTQNKLERLSKLDTLNKPIAPIPPAAPVIKVKPVASPIPSTSKPAANNFEAEKEKPTNSLGLTVNTNQQAINNSKSLIDLKSTEIHLDSLKSAEESENNEKNPPQVVDLLFDVNEDQSFTLNTEPLKLGSSYFDLIGLANQSNEAPTAPNIRATTPVALKTDLAEFAAGDLKFDTTSFNQAELLDKSFNKPIQNSNSQLFKIEEQAEENLSNKLTETNVANTNSNETYNQVPSIDILITEPVNEKDDNNVVPDNFFNLKHEKPHDQSRSASPSNAEKKDNALNKAESHNDLKNIVLEAASMSKDEKILTPTVLSPAVSSSSIATTPVIESTLSNDFNLDFFLNTASEPIPSSKPIKPVSRSTTPTSLISKDTIQLSSPSIVRSRPVAASNKSRSASPSSELNGESKEQVGFATPSLIRKKEQGVKKVYSSNNPTEESSSSEEDDQKFQIRIRPKPQKALDSQDPVASPKAAFVPLLPRPPKSLEEIEEFRQRRLSSDGGSITRSIKEDESSDDDVKKIENLNSAPAISNEEKRTNDGERKDSVHSEYNLELPDEDDLQPLAEFNDKCEVKRYADGSYGCIVLVRQPFRNANLMYKNALQKFTEVRTWTECLVKLVDVPPNRKKLLFYNAHEIITLATSVEASVDKIIDLVVSNETKEEAESNAAAESKAEAESEIEAVEKKINIKKIHPFHEIELKASYKFSELCLQQYDNYSKIHTFKLQEIIFKETIQIRPDRIMALPERFLKKFTKAKVTSLLDHTPIPFEICKFAHLNYSHLHSFLLLLQDAFWTLPTLTRKLQREQQLEQLKLQPTTTQSISAAAASFFSLGANKQINTASLNSVTASHTREEVTVKAVDEYKCKLDKDCRVLEHRSRTRIFLINFLNAPDPAIEIGLNDCLRHGKEIVGRHDIIPIKTEQWISPEMFELNENVVNREEFEKTHCLRCLDMPDNLLVEIMRFRTRPRRNYELPLQVRCYMNIVNRQVQIRIECTVSGTYYTKLSEVHCADIQIRFPLPDVWVYLFRVQKTFHYGAVHSTKSKFGKIKGLDRFLVHKSQTQGALMEASCGKAKYEQAFRSLVWRIEQLPVKNKDIYKTHLLVCKLNLQEYDNMPESYEQIAKVQYQVSTICASSKCQVRSISVNTCEEPPEKWVKLKSKFDYDLDINYSFDPAELPAVDKENCAELQNISQTESEGEHNEEEDDD